MSSSARALVGSGPAASSSSGGGSKKGQLSIESEDVIRLILQFCRDNDLPRTLMTLQEEAKVPLNSVDSLEGLLDDVNAGRWDDVLKTCSYLALPMDVKVDLFEHVVFEFVESLEFETAGVLMEHTQPLKVMRGDFPDRFARLSQLIKRGQPVSSPEVLYGPGKTRKDKRGDVAQKLVAYVQVSPPNRLLALLGQAIKYQKHIGVIKEGEEVDLFRGLDKNLFHVTAMGEKGLEAADQYPKHCAKRVKLAEVASFCAYSSDGQFLAVGAEDGLAEIYDARTGKSRQDLCYQSVDDPRYMAAQHPVSCVMFSNNNASLAVGDSSGTLSVFVVGTGDLDKRLQAHDGPILSLCWNHNDSAVLSGSADSTARVSGLNAGKVLKEFRGHTSYVQTVLYSPDMSKVITGSADAYVKVFDAKTCTALHSFHPPTPVYLGAAGNLLSINQIVLAPDSVDKSNPTIFVSTECNQISKMNLQGQVLKTFTSGKLDSASDFRNIAVSRSGSYVYGISKDQCLYIFDGRETKLVHILPEVADKEVLGVAVHPLRPGYLAVWSLDRTIGLLRP